MDFDTLRSLAFHREMVASRRLMQCDDLPLDSALKQVLSEVAGKQGLDQMLEVRRLEQVLLIENKEKKRHQSQQRHHIKQAKKAIPAAKWCAWFDGSARPNPGSCTIGAVLNAPDGRSWQLSCPIGYGNSSAAEYHALIALLKLAIEHDASDIVIYGDSRVVIDDLDPKTKNHAQALTDFRCEAKRLLQQIHGASLQWIPRVRNQRADILAQRAFEKNTSALGAIV
ncbi:ribonuclease HI family protein [Undibacterium sp. Di24W]|uniref:ribonuclease HI family protein n=1 Tax=Undibacterium sp. Di24W TaxID=3413033 RepID=UPI003BF33DC8